MARFLQTRVQGATPSRGVLFAFYFVLALSSMVSCTKIEEENYPDKIPERPAMLFSDTTLLDFYEGPALSWKLKTAWLERWGGDGKVFAKPILVDIFDSLGYKVAFLRSDSGELDSRMSYVKAYGHVYALTPNGASVRADSLSWNKHENIVQTESYVRVVSEDGDVLQGKGFISDARLENWQIKSNVTGIFQDAADRIKGEDEKARQQMILSSSSDSSGVQSSTQVASSQSNRTVVPSVSSSSMGMSSTTSNRLPLRPLKKGITHPRRGAP